MNFVDRRMDNKNEDASTYRNILITFWDDAKEKVARGAVKRIASAMNLSCNGGMWHIRLEEDKRLEGRLRVVEDRHQQEAGRHLPEEDKRLEDMLRVEQLVGKQLVGKQLVGRQLVGRQLVGRQLVGKQQVEVGMPSALVPPVAHREKQQALERGKSAAKYYMNMATYAEQLLCFSYSCLSGSKQCSIMARGSKIQ